jgi:nitrogen fixation-related uncharacterized protein
MNPPFLPALIGGILAFVAVLAIVAFLLWAVKRKR